VAYRRGHLIERLAGSLRRSNGGDRDLLRLSEKKRTLEEATQQWLALLRDMEHEGQSSDPRYETYYRAYLDAKRQEERAELDLFNIRRGLVD
jgi:hypothetical protein